MTYSVSPIGFVRSCFKEKFAIPRQPQLAPAARGVLELVPPFDQGDAVQGLEQVSHVWVDGMCRIYNKTAQFPHAISLEAGLALWQNRAQVCARGHEAS